LKTVALHVWINCVREQSVYGFSQKTTESQNFKAQTPQAHAGESPQETPALQSLKRFTR
jgi:hypothetical protein